MGASTADTISQLQECNAELCAMFFNYAGALQRDAPPQAVNDLPVQPKSSSGAHTVASIPDLAAQVSDAPCSAHCHSRLCFQGLWSSCGVQCCLTLADACIDRPLRRAETCLLSANVISRLPRLSTWLSWGSSDTCMANEEHCQAHHLLCYVGCTDRAVLQAIRRACPEPAGESAHAQGAVADDSQSPGDPSDPLEWHTTPREQCPCPLICLRPRGEYSLLAQNTASCST